MIKTASPRFKKALRDCKKIEYFLDLWLSYLYAAVDSAADWAASKELLNIDVTTNPGSARLTVVANSLDIEQLSHNTNLDLYIGFSDPLYQWRIVFQTFPLSLARRLDAVTLRFDGSAAAVNQVVVVYVVKDLAHWTGSDGTAGYTGIIHHQFSITVPAGAAAADYRTVFDPAPDLPPGNYTLVPVPTIAASCVIRYQNTDVYAGGDMKYQTFVDDDSPWNSQWFYPTITSTGGDLYFKLEFGAFAPSGRVRTRRIDLGEVPAFPGEYRITAAVPSGTALTTDLYAYADAETETPSASYLDVKDGQILAPARYWEQEHYATANADLNATPEVDLGAVMFPKSRVRCRPRGVNLLNVAPDILEDFQPLLKPVTIAESELKLIERVSTRGDMTVNLEDTRIETLQRIVSDCPLKNFRAVVYAGMDVPGFTASDLFECFIGIVNTADVTPKFRKDVFGLSLQVKNTILELKRRVPVADYTGLVDTTSVSINYDGWQVMDGIVDLLRGKAQVPGRYMDLESYLLAKPDLGYESLASGALLIRASDAAGLPDTRKLTPEEVIKYLPALLIIADGYQVVDVTGRLAFVRHNAAAAAEAIWCDESMIADLPTAVPIIEMGRIKLGYDDLLFNLIYTGHSWSGSGDNWGTDFTTYSTINADSTERYAPAGGFFLSVMEKNMKDVAKWLGPEAGYNGATIAQALGRLLIGRHKNPPARIIGCSMPTSEFERGQGSVIQIHSKEFCKYRRRGIALSETLKFMVTLPRYDQGRNRMSFDLVELL